jgi:hypothetical protein
MTSPVSYAPRSQLTARPEGERLRDRIELLQEENRQLRDRIARLTGRDDAAKSRLAFGLTDGEALIFCTILHCGLASYSTLIDVLWHDRDEDLPEEVECAVRSHVKRLRRRLRPYGVNIGTVYSIGVSMDEAMRARSRRIMEASESVPVSRGRIA